MNTLCARQRILVLDETSFSSRRLEAFRHRPRKESSRVLILHVVSENFSDTRCCGEVWMFCSRNPHASTRTFSLSTPQESVIPLIIADNTELSTYRLCERNAHHSFKLKICSVFFRANRSLCEISGIVSLLIFKLLYPFLDSLRNEAEKLDWIPPTCVVLEGFYGF